MVRSGKSPILSYGSQIITLLIFGYSFSLIMLLSQFDDTGSNVIELGGKKSNK